MSVTPHSGFDELKATGKLPSPSGVALAIIELCRKDGTSIEEIAHAVRADPALSGRILKFANAAAHAPRRPIVSVPEAIQVVGINTVRQLVLGFSLLPATLILLSLVFLFRYRLDHEVVEAREVPA